ncbi:MAG: hypothetical protein OJF52_002544 [Nitrospira sp.]|nr:MAG: hypothetical protein OJF52_002544 [Nitrospira sp.]
MVAPAAIKEPGVGIGRERRDTIPVGAAPDHARETFVL